MTPPPARPADFYVDLIRSILISRLDAASILAAAASRISGSSSSIGEPGVLPGTPQTETVASTYARLASIQNALLKWHEWPAESRCLRAISHSVSSRNRPESASKPSGPGVKPGAPSSKSPITVKFLDERSREERDAELKMGALSISPTQSAPPSIASASLQFARPIPSARQNPHHHLLASEWTHLELVHGASHSRSPNNQRSPGERSLNVCMQESTPRSERSQNESQHAAAGLNHRNDVVCAA